jgi:hypothetical protein
VDERFVHTTYRDRDIVNRYTVAGGSRVAYSGGPGGIRHDPAPEERMAEREQHTAPTSFQSQHESAARADRGSYVKNNGGHPATLAVARPLGANPQNMHQVQTRQTPQMQSRPMAQSQQQRPTTQTQQRPMTQMQNRPVQQPQAQSRSVQQPEQQSGPTPQTQQRPVPQAQSRPAPQAQSRPAPQAKPSAKPKSEHEPK